MYEPLKIHLSHDEAREELKKRWGNTELKCAIEKELGGNFMSQFSEFPRGVSFRQLVTPDNGFTLFFQGAKYVGAEPLVLEIHKDMFVSFNEEKKGLGRLRVTIEDGTRATVDIMDFHANEKKKLGECVLKTGENLVDFHHNLIKVSGYNADIFDNSKWLGQFGGASGYYYPFLLHFVAHGVLFENVESYEENDSGASFINGVTVPAIKKIEEMFGIKPLIVRMYPQNQSEKEDFYWWTYPPAINEYLLDYVTKNKFIIKKHYCPVKIARPEGALLLVI